MTHSRDDVYRLLLDGLIELRHRGHELRDGPTFHLADVLHNLPGWIKRLEDGDVTADEVIEHLRTHRGEPGREWVDHRLGDSGASDISEAGE